jgi:death-on-curing protein
VTVYLSIEQIEELHELQVERFGGAPGLRDRGALEAAAARPAMTFGGEDLYPDIPAKAAAVMQSLVMNHPYLDGNKRIAVNVAEFFSELDGYRLEASNEELEQITLAVARGEMDAEPLTIWFRQSTSRSD